MLIYESRQACFTMVFLAIQEYAAFLLLRLFSEKIQ